MSNYCHRHDVFGEQVNVAIILGVAIVKALCVAFIFMHLKFDWGKVYFIVIPVTVMGIMMMIVLMPDIMLAWWN